MLCFFVGGIIMLQSTSEYEERNFDDIQRALDIEHTVKALESQLCYLIYRLRQTFGLISEKELIVSTASGYQFNPDLHIMTDYQQFDDLIQLASKASSVINRVELLKNAIDLYCGKILSSADGEHWLIQFAAKYHIAYVGAVNELLKQLNALHSYDLLNQYAARSLAIVPENSRGYYWLIHSLKVQGMDELASNEYQLAKQHLTTEEYKELCTSLGDSCE